MVKHYKKEFGRLTKRERNYEDLEELVHEQEMAVEEIKHTITAFSCSKCSSTAVTIADFGIRSYKFCTSCGYREKLR